MMDFPNITSAFLNLTNACNLACKYCFVEQNPKRMKIQTAIDAANWLAENAGGKEIPSITFFGGEPLLMWESVVKPLTEYIRKKYGDRYSLSITSNCTLINEDIASFLKSNNVSLLLSMDGDRKSQELNRPMRNGKSSFDVLDGKLKMLLHYFPDLMFRSTVTPKTANDLFHNVMYAKDKGFRNWFTMPNYFEEWSEAEKKTLREQMSLYRDYYIEAMRDKEEPIYFTQLEKYFPRIVQRNACIKNDDRRECLACDKCGLGTSRYAGISINGDVVSCQEFFSHEQDSMFYIGNIYSGVDNEKREKLSELWNGAEVTGDHCEDCKLRRICDGGCVANNYFKSGDLHRSPDIACEWNRILFDMAVAIMQTLGKENNEAFLKRWKTYVR